MTTVDIHCDILIVGGSAGGTAAALAAAHQLSQVERTDREGTTYPVCLIEETPWLGGQLTSQGVCTPDEHRHIETFGATRRYIAFRKAVRDHYRTRYVLSQEAAADPHFNPGNCWVSALAYEPQVGADMLRAMTRPYEESGVLRIYSGARATACEMDDEHDAVIAAVSAQAEDGSILRFVPRYVLDATDLGDLLPLCGRQGNDWIVGAESHAETGEPDAPNEPRPDWVQPFTFPFALEWSPETATTNVIPPPEDYEALKAQQNYKIMHGAITGLFKGRAPWWKYRRLLAAENFADARIPNDVAMINTAGNDYYGGNIIGANAGSPADIAATLARARRASLGYVYWLQTECPREEGDEERGEREEGREISRYLNVRTPEPPTGYPEFKLRTDLFPTADGCSILPYIRESRRIRSKRSILEQEIVVRDFKGGECRGDQARAVFMPDSVGIGHYALDIHPNGHGEPNAYVPTRPFQIPLGALIPVRLENLLPACKNLGVTHLTNGAYRLHPIEWNIGESAGLLAAYCLETGLKPVTVYATEGAIREFQAILLRQGIALNWYIDVPSDHKAFYALQTLATAGVSLGSDLDLLFRPEDPITDHDWRLWCTASGVMEALPLPRSRAEAAICLGDKR